MITVPGKIARAGGKTVIVPELAIDREIARQEIQTVEIRLFDGREISPEQRRKIFAIIGDIAWYSGHEPEYLRKLLTLEFVKDKGCEFFSLSNCEKSTATEFISWLIDFCFRCMYQQQMALRYLRGAERREAGRIIRRYRMQLRGLSPTKLELPLKQQMWLWLSQRCFIGTCQVRNLLKVGI